MKKTIIRVTTVPASLNILLKGQLKFISDYYEVIGISSDDSGRLQKVSEQEKIKVIPVEMTRKITPIRDLRALYKLYKIFKKHKPYIVHSHTPKAGTLSMIAAKISGVPHRLHTIAGLPLVEAKGVKRTILNLVEKITYKCATKIYPNSFGLVDIILENKFTKSKKLKVIANGSSNGIDTSHFNPSLYNELRKNELRKELHIHKGDLVAIYVGRLVKDKGVNELIESFTKISSKNKNYKLLIAGPFENNLDPLLPETTKQIETNRNIIYVGWQDDVRPFLAIADFLVFPSYREGFPNVVMQAASMGLASIVTDINGCNEIIKEDFNGKIIQPKSTEQLHNSMLTLYRNETIRKKLAKNARESIINRFERKLVWDSMLKEYRELD